MAFTLALRRLNVVAAARALGMAALPETLAKASPRKRTRLARDFSNTWLEFHFGWEPLVKDIGDAAEVLQSDFGSKHVSAKGTTRITSIARTFPVNTVQVIKRDFKVSARISGDIIITNPNLYLANHMGFINPAVVAWVLVPFSFVVDWFVNVGDFLSSYTDLIGVTLSNTSNTMFSKSTFEEMQLITFPSQPWYNTTITGSMDAVRFQRVLGIGSGPALKTRPPKRVSAVRGATAISLLVQQLRGK